MTLAQVSLAAEAVHLAIFGALHPESDVPDGTGTLILLGPREPGFWAYITSEPEFTDGGADPMDRWSRRVISQLANDMSGTAIFPFGGPPYTPFLRWAEASGRAWPSPAGMLVHDQAGLFVSYRGALALPERLALPAPPEKPCRSCAAPCATTCPVDALGPQGYDTVACHAYLNTEAGQDCLAQGCKARRACPVSEGYGRLAAQSAYHMGIFHK